MNSFTYSFESFVVGKRSEAAFSAARAVAENPRKVHNPLLLYGRNGCGKTHLLYAIANTMRLRWPEMRIVNLSAQALADQMIAAIASNSVQAFRQSLTTADALLLDHASFDKKPRTREETVLRLEEALRAGAQVVVASDSFEDTLFLTLRFSTPLFAVFSPCDGDRIALG